MSGGDFIAFETEASRRTSKRFGEIKDRVNRDQEAHISCRRREILPWAAGLKDRVTSWHRDLSAPLSRVIDRILNGENSTARRLKERLNKRLKARVGIDRPWANEPAHRVIEAPLAHLILIH